MSSNSRHIPLNRHFKQLRTGEVTAHDPWQSYIEDFGGYWGSTHDWGKLLEHPGIVVVLGEPGSGKTWEFRHTVDEQTAKGCSAFFLPLDRLSDEPISQILDQQQLTAFEQWKNGSKNAHFLLDSVDEAKLVRVSDFYAALDRLRNELGHAIRRAHIILSSRISEWRPESDHAEVLDRLGSHLPKAAKNRAEDPRLLVVELMPLDRERIKIFAADQCKETADAFLEELDKRHAWEFAGRPLDVLLLISYWRRHRQLGSLTETLEYLVTEQLQEREERRERAANRPLAADRARRGAEYLAAASLFCRNVSFQVPDEACAMPSSGLRVQDCLPGDWSHAERLALIDRPLFDSASYGRIRFHHRRIAEYLAACWLRERMSLGLAWSDVERLLFDTRRFRYVLRPSLGNVAAWLVCLSDEPWSQRLREALLAHAPHVFLQSGDPEHLGPGFKAKVVEQFVRANRDHDSGGITSDAATLSRLSDPTLSASLSGYVVDSTITDVVRIELLHLIRRGRLTKCKPALLTVLRDTRTAPVLKAIALRALQPIANRSEREQVAETATNWDKYPEFLLDDLFATIGPEGFLPQIWVRLIRAIANDSTEDSRRTLRGAFDGITSTTDAATLRIFLSEIESLLTDAPKEPATQSDLPISRRSLWLAHLSWNAVVWLLSRQNLNDWERQWIGRMICRLTWGPLRGVVYPGRESFASETLQHPEVRRVAYWLATKQEKEDGQTTQRLGWLRACRFNFPLGFVPTSKDLKWLLDDSKERSSVADQVSCLFVALRYGRRWTIAERWQILRASLRLPHFRSYLWWHWIWIRNALLGPFYRRGYDSPFHLQWWKDLPGRLKDRCYQFNLRWWLIWYRADYRAAKRCGLLRQMIVEVGRKENCWRRSSVDWDKMQAKRGLRTTKAIRAGCIRVWQEHTPDAHGESQGIPDLGLVGLELAIEADERFFEKLSSTDATRAALYATHEMNGLADWLPQLALHHPSEVVAALKRSIQVEWGDRDTPGKHHHVLQSLATRMNTVTKLMAPSVSELLLDRDPQTDGALESALQILSALGQKTLSEWAVLAQVRIQSYSIKERKLLCWLVIWLDADAPAALSFLEAILETIASDRDEIARMFAGISGRSGYACPRLETTTLQEIPNWTRLIRLCYHWINPADDIRRPSGKVFSPVSRDEAQSFRWYLLDHLAKRPELEAESALEALLDSPSLGVDPEMIRYLLDRRIKEQADGRPLEPSQIVMLGTNLESPPSTMSDLFALVCKRLQVIKEEVEIPDSASLRSAVQPGNNEAHLRTFLASQLITRSGGWYRVEQEAEIDRGQKPDLRVSHPQINGAVPVEVKLADKDWTVSELFERLENQLVGQYLRARDCTHGVFLLGIAEDRSWRDPHTQAMLTFNQVIERLRQRALELELAHRDRAVESIKVVGIDFRTPLRR